MNRNDWLWIVIKAFGLYLVVEAALRLPNFVFLFSGRPGSGEQALLVSLNFGVHAILGLYLLKSGRLIYRLIPPE
jgi:hypothetical protein